MSKTMENHYNFLDEERMDQTSLETWFIWWNLKTWIQLEKITRF